MRQQCKVLALAELLVDCCVAELSGEACGVVGIFAPGEPVAHLNYLALYALQHRGQESAGIAMSDGKNITVVKDMGLVATVFDDRTLATLDGYLGIGHVRYSTAGASSWSNAQPVFRSTADQQFVLGHNGNLTNTAMLAKQTSILAGMVGSDSDLIGELLAVEIAAMSPSERLADQVLQRALCAVLPRLEGAFSLVLADEKRVIGVRDPNGFRPLCLGRLDNGWVLASETPALDIVGAQFERELEPGEMLVIDDAGVHTSQPFVKERIDPRLCIFEFVYFSRPDSVIYGQSVHHARVRMGELLATQSPVEADLVMGVPESGLPAAEGFARVSGIPYGHGLVKNRYIGRTFIAPNQKMRFQGVRMKLNPLRSSICGNRLVVVDDSIVRGTTTRALVAMLREAGAVEVHLRISSPPYRWPCFFGMDTGDSSELLAARLSVEQICEYVGADTLAFIDVEGLTQATGVLAEGFCNACLTGNYPIDVGLVDVAAGIAEAGAVEVG